MDIPTPSLSRVLSAAVIVSTMTTSGSLNAQQPVGNLMEQIVGTWSVVAQYVDQNGKKLEPFGSNPKGIAIFDRNRRFVFVAQRGSLPKFASNNRLTGTAEENQAIVQGSIAYFGRYSIDENERKIQYHFDGSTYPNW